MVEKRRAERRATNLDIEYKVTEIDLGQAIWVEAKGTIINISEKGFSITTPHQLQKGHVVMIKKGENPDVRLSHNSKKSYCRHYMLYDI